jgi:hypothetical protein
MKKPLRIIFLDIDGVLNNKGSFKDPQMDPLDPNAIQLLNDLVRDTEACIVISSAWRIGNTLHWIQLMMRRAGFRFPERIIGATMEIPKDDDGDILALSINGEFERNRGQEIALWLKQVQADSFVIFDDDDDMDPVQDHLIRTTFDSGLLEEHIEQAKKMLNG